MLVKRGEVWLAAPRLPAARDIHKSRPVLVVSPPEMHDHLRTVIVAPVTSKGTAAPFRLGLRLGGKGALVVLDQLHSIDKVRLIRRVGALSPTTLKVALDTLRQTFAP